MPDQVPEPTLSKTDLDTSLRRIREYVSAGISGVVMLGTILMMILAFRHLNQAEEFARIKDLLLFINPLLGVVIGYYFNKTTSEARAEKAEATATTAMASAQQAAEDRNQAQSTAEAAKDEAQEAKAVLKEVGEAAEKMAAQVPVLTGGVLSPGDEGGEPVLDARLEFQMAWKRAKRLIE